VALFSIFFNRPAIGDSAHVRASALDIVGQAGAPVAVGVVDRITKIGDLLRRILDQCDGQVSHQFGVINANIPQLIDIEHYV
jgi:hypothetical protein